MTGVSENNETCLFLITHIKILIMRKHLFFFVIYLISVKTFSQSVAIEKLLVSNYDEKVINDPLIDYKRFKTYSIISANVLFNNEPLTLEEKQIEFFLINVIDPVLGLKNISLKDSVKPDLMFIYSFSNDYKEKYIPPQTYSVPIWSPGRTTTINSNSNANINTYGDLNVYGNANSNNNTTITQSGKWETSQVQRPAYTEGKFFPDFSLTIYNTSDNNKIWEGNANGTSTQKDFRLAAQRLSWGLLSKMPRGSYIDTNFLKDNNGLLGISFYIFNSNGVSFYPVIFSIIEKSAADKKGLEKFDVILSVNGESTANKMHKQIHDMIRGNEGTKIDLVIDRKGKIIKKTLIKTKRNK